MYHTHFLNTRIILSRSSDKVKLKLAEEGLKARSNLSYVTPTVVGFKTEGGNVTATVVDELIEESFSNVTSVLADTSKRVNVTARQAACLQSSPVTRSNERKTEEWFWNVTPMAAGRSIKGNVTARQATCLQLSLASRPNESKRTKFKKTRINGGQSYFAESTNKFYLSGGNYQLGLVISTRDVIIKFSIIKVNDYTRMLMWFRLSKARRGEAKKHREPRRTMRISSSIKPLNIQSQIYEGDYTPNYDNVVISTRAVFAVISVIKYTQSHRSPNMFRHPRSGRTTSTKAREDMRTLENSYTIKANNLYTKANGRYYTSNCYNLEISTRDVSAVITLIMGGHIDEKITFKIEKLLNTHSKFYVKRGGAYGGMLNYDSVIEHVKMLKLFLFYLQLFLVRQNRTTKTRVGNVATAMPKNFSFKRPLRANFRKSRLKFLSLMTSPYLSYREIWLYKTKGIVQMNHRDKIKVTYWVYNGFLCVSRLLLKITDVYVTLISALARKKSRSVTHRLKLWASKQDRSHARVGLLTGKHANLMVTAMPSIGKSNPKRQQITIITVFQDCASEIMSEAETQSAVAHIPGMESDTAQVTRDLVDIPNLAQGNESSRTTLVYDPVNDIYKRVTMNTVSTRDVGEGRHDDITDTGTESLVAPTTTTSEEVNTPPDTPTAVTEEEPSLSSVLEPTTVTKTVANRIQATDPSQHATGDLESSSSSSSTTSESECDGNAEFSPASEGDQPRKKLPHELIDARIQRQKEKYWKKVGKDVDPRITALVPIHAPKMERLSRLQALKQRAMMKPKPKEGDIVTNIMHEINKTTELNYCVTPVGANFIMESELGNPANTVNTADTTNCSDTNPPVTTVIATNNPNSARPKPPKMKQSRVDKVLPFPGRRKQAEQARSKEANLEDKADSILESDESWPTDQDDAIPSFRRNNVKNQKSCRRRKQVKKPTKKPKKPERKTKVKKLTKANVTAMVYQIRDPIPMETWDVNLKLDAIRAKKMAKDQKIRMRQRECRARKKAEKEKKLSQPPQDVLAQAINLSNILGESDNDYELEDFLMSLEDQGTTPTPSRFNGDEQHGASSHANTSPRQYPLHSSDDESMEEGFEAHIDSLADQHLQEEQEETSESDDDWRTGVTLLRNPFAITEQPVAQAAPPVQQGYFTQQGLLKQQQQQIETLKRKAGIISSSVLKVILNEKEVSEYLDQRRGYEQKTAESQSQQQQLAQELPEVAQEILESQATPTRMSAKNISKDRSTSRGRAGNQNKFDKGRGQPEQEEMDHDHESQEEQGNAPGKGKRQRDPPKTGSHDNTTAESSDDEVPGAKRNMTSLREKLTHVYQKKTKETREKRDETRTTPSVAFRVDKTHAGEKVKSTSVPLLEPVKLADAPTLSLKDLVPEQDKYGIESQGQDESFKSDRIEFVIVERELALGEAAPTSGSDRDYEWEIPERSDFDAIMGQAIDKYTETDWDRIDFLTFSSVGWNTGVGLFAFGSDKLEQMNIFRDIIRTIQIGNKCFESYPKRMLLNRYALTIYFNAAFQWNSELKLLFFIKKLNGFKGELTMAETRFYPEDHPTRKGCKIVACEADQQFLDELYKYPKDHAFSIRFGGNLYIRGGERIDPDDPDAVRQRRPKLTRSAAKKFIQGSGEDILNNGQKADDEAAKQAREEHARKYVRWVELFTYHVCQYVSNVIPTFFVILRGVVIGKKLTSNIPWNYRENKGWLPGNFNRSGGNSKVGRAVTGTAYMNERNIEKNGGTTNELILKINNYNDPYGTNVYLFDLTDCKKYKKRCIYYNQGICVDFYMVKKEGDAIENRGGQYRSHNKPCCNGSV